MKLTSIQLDRAIGAVLASAAGDALGAPYEFGPALPDSFTPAFGRGTFGHEPGEWTDDTSMAMPILAALARGERIEEPAVRVQIVREWLGWAHTAKDVGNQTRAALSLLPPDFDESDITAASRKVHERSGRSAGNGALMRTGPLALGYLDRPRDELWRAAVQMSSLTHWDADSGIACAIWCTAIRHAILTGELDVRGQVPTELPDAARWLDLIDEAQAPGAHPRDFERGNGWVVRAFQGALVAASGATSLVDTLERAVRGGHDTDTVAAIAGSLAGAVWGGSAVPLQWKRMLHGWPGLRADDLVRLAALAARHGAADREGWPSASRQPIYERSDFLARHPHDPQVWIGSIAALDRLPADVDAVVSLCRVGTEQVPTRCESVQVWLIDQDGRNPNLDLVLTEAADAVAALRAEGKTVFLHCAEGRSRTSAVAALFGARHRGVALEQAWSDVAGALPGFAPQWFLRDAVARIAQQSDKPNAAPYVAPLE